METGNNIESGNDNRPISLGAAISLTSWSERTLWRRLASGTLRRAPADRSGRTMLEFSAIRPHLRFDLDDELMQLLFEADAGAIDAQTDFAVALMSRHHFNSAIYWLEMACRSGNPEAMHWLGRCYLSGAGANQDEALGLMWLSRAAAAGHPISQEIVREMCQRFINYGEGLRRISPVPTGTYGTRAGVPPASVRQDAPAAAAVGRVYVAS